MDTGNENVKPFACPACSSRFTRPENLNRHKVSVHRRSNIRPFTCPLCDVSFSRSDLRKRHIRKCHPEDATNQRQIQHANPIHSAITPKATGDKATFGSSQRRESVATPAATNALEPAPAASIFSADNISWLFRLPQFISAYFLKFHTIVPLLHQPTFDATTAPQPLLQAVACIGAVYLDGRSDDNYSICLALVESGLQALDAHVREHRHGVGFRQLWVLQAYLLFEYFAIHSCKDGLFTKALKIHRRLVDGARQYQLLQDGVGDEDGFGASDQDQPSSNSPPATVDGEWELMIRSEARKRIMYTLFYLDAQLAVCCNLRPLLTALEIKHELPCRDDVWAATTAEAWHTLMLMHGSGSGGGCSSFNDEDDDDAANGDPRPDPGDLYSSLMHLMGPGSNATTSASGRRPLGLLWNSSFTSLILVTQVLMMIRDLTLGSIFLYHNIRNDDAGSHTLSIINESGRAQVMQALDALADLMPRQQPLAVDTALWNHVWTAWHYAALCLTHQDGLLTNGIVECSLPTAVSMSWELGKPRSKPLRDVYEDRDVVRVVGALERILALLARSELGGDGAAAEDPFTTMLVFKSCLMGWRTVRLLALSHQQQQQQQQQQSDGTLTGESGGVSAHAVFSRCALYSILSVVDPGVIPNSRRSGGSSNGCGNYNNAKAPAVGHTPDSKSSSHVGILSDSEARYLEYVEAALVRRDVWPLSKWVEAVFAETK